MALRFRCEQCGKRLQVDQEPGAAVMCPYCKNTVVVPADAQAYSPGQPAQATPGQQEELEQEEEATGGDAFIAFMATYLPSWGTSVVLHLAMVLVALMATWVATKQPEDAEYQAQTVIKEKKRLIRQQKSAPKSRTTRKAMSKKVSSFVFKQTKNPIPDFAQNQLRPIEVIGIGAGGRDFGGIAGFGTGRGGGSGGPDFFGVGGVAEKIVYVVDRSGSMTDLSLIHI